MTLACKFWALALRGDSIMWLSHSIRPGSKHFHVRITIWPLVIIDICPS